MCTPYSSELKTILEHYDLGELTGFQQDERGTVNTSFTIELLKDDQRRVYFFRRYKKGVRREEIICEHSMINRLKSRGFDIVAGVLPTRNRTTFVHQSDEIDDQNGAFYAIFDFLPGEDRYTWIGPVCTEAEITSAAAVLARFHHSLFGFVPSGSRMEPRIMELLPLIEDALQQCALSPKGTSFDSLLLHHLKSMKDNLQQTRKSLERCLDEQCPEIVIHCDYHPGNLKFEDEQVVGVFDLDWSKIDYRCFDIALAIFYFSVSWEADQDGQLRLDDVTQFLSSYQQTMVGGLQPGPLTMQELHCLPDMIAAANFYVLNWAILDYLHKDVNPEEYMVYLKHAIRTMQWLEEKDHRSALRDRLKEISVRTS